VSQHKVHRLQSAKGLVQGTICPDAIESAGAKQANGAKKATTIGSHHNVGGLPETLGLPPENVCRDPFPGPGLGVRILGEVKLEYAALLQRAGVMGDGRTYEHVVALRAVQTSDFMTADWAELPYALLKKVSSRIINEVRGINRVTYDVSSKPPATIEWK